MPFQSCSAAREISPHAALIWAEVRALNTKALPSLSVFGFAMNELLILSQKTCKVGLTTAVANVC